MSAELDRAYRLLAEVAAAVSLQEGESGVLRVLRALASNGPAGTRQVSRVSGLPVPVVAAVQNELRSRGRVGRERPAGLTGAGRELARTLAVEQVPATGCCPGCHGSGTVVPQRLQPVVAALAELMARAPAVDLSLDQSFCTAESKVRRVLHMVATGGLPAPGLLAVGDDDLVSLAVLAVGRELGVRLVGELGVVDVSADLLDFIAEHGEPARGGTDLVLVRHDLRRPLPEPLRRRFTVAMTDPPYTVPGARLFLARALEGLRPGPGRDVYLHLGPKGPGEWLEVCAALVELGLATSSMVRGFSEYEGSGVLGGISHALHLVTADPPGGAVTVGEYDGVLYTAQLRAAVREYACAGCGERFLVGPGAVWPTVSGLKQAGCPRCGGTRFRAGRLVPGGAGPDGGGPGRLAR